MQPHSLFLLASSRKDGNSEQLARAAAAHLPAGVKQTWLHLADHPLPSFEDLRHNGQSYPAPEGHAKVLLDATLEATDLVVVAPLYWYSLPTLAKRYLDEWSAWLRLPDVHFRDRMTGKKLYAITTHTGKKEEVEPLTESLRLSAEYMKMQYQGALIGWGSRPGDVQRDTAALEQAQAFFHRQG
ncbi:flavodoxin family protein [Deinococcus roseus]|uniref:Flavodoxin n=1 Tax=Deinococcus roseus TaxID=392414 RepID=A0ABQ2D0L5_9DEIO|nr:NAD(P)H-dependent oxidoreductase [Deinococcus roseus]GGJ39546.1 flavodoxin [Deinococcus roseus]